MKKALRKEIAKTGRIAGAGAIAVLLPVILAGMASAKKKEKAYLPDYVLKAQTVYVVIMPDAGEPVDDPSANRKAQEEVEKAFLKWGRLRLTQDKYTADLVVGIRKGTAKAANPTINGGPVDSRPGTIETTDDKIRIGAQQGRPPDLTTQGPPPEPARAGMEAGAQDDTLMVFIGGAVEYPLDHAPVWRYTAKNGLKPPRVEAVEEFRKALEESDKAAAQKQQQQQQGQKKNP